MKEKISLASYFFIGSMLFGMYFGAGNLIFPVHMGQEAGYMVIPAALGFIISASGLPFLGTIAIGVSENGNLINVASKVSKSFGYFFTILLYITIGPLFAIPRTATVSFEVGFAKFLPQNMLKPGLFIFTLTFFLIAFFFSLYPNKLVFWVGKILNPIFLVLITFLIIASIIKPMGNIYNMEAQVSYQSNAFFKGITEGYNTMDALASLAFGILIVNAIKKLGINEPKEISKSMVKTGMVCVILMVIIYASLAFIGASSLGAFELSQNGGIALAQITHFYFGIFGSLLLALLVTVACIKTAIGLISACSDVFVEMFPGSLSYKAYALIFTIFSMLLSNIGLTQIISLAIPVLMFLYPICIGLIFLTLFAKYFEHSQIVYITTIVSICIFSIGDALKTLPSYIGNIVLIKALTQVYSMLPLSNINMSWFIPAIIGFIIGIIIKSFAKN